MGQEVVGHAMAYDAGMKTSAKMAAALERDLEVAAQEEGARAAHTVEPMVGQNDPGVPSFRVEDIIDPKSIDYKIGKMSPLSRSLVSQFLGTDTIMSVEQMALSQLQDRGQLDLMEQLKNVDSEFYTAIQENDSGTLTRMLFARGLITPGQLTQVTQQNKQLGLAGLGDTRTESMNQALTKFEFISGNFAHALNLPVNPETGTYDGYTRKMVEESFREGEDLGQILSTTMRLRDGIATGDQEIYGILDPTGKAFDLTDPAGSLEQFNLMAAHLLSPALLAAGADLIETDVQNQRHNVNLERWSDWLGFGPSADEARSFAEVIAEFHSSAKSNPLGHNGNWSQSAAFSAALGLNGVYDIYLNDELLIGNDLVEPYTPERDEPSPDTPVSSSVNANETEMIEGVLPSFDTVKEVTTGIARGVQEGGRSLVRGLVDFPENVVEFLFGGTAKSETLEAFDAFFEGLTDEELTKAFEDIKKFKKKPTSRAVKRLNDIRARRTRAHGVN